VDDWNQEVLHPVQEHGWTSARRVARDGTLGDADASRHRLLNHAQLQPRRQVLDAAGPADVQGPPPPEQPYGMAPTAPPRRRQRDQDAVAQTKLDERGADHRRRIPSERPEEQNVRISVTAPEAALGKDKLKVERPWYTVPYGRDVDSPLIVGYETLAPSRDAGTLVPRLQRMEQWTGHRPEVARVDSGSVTALDRAEAQEWGVALYGPWKENDDTAAAAPPAQQWSKDQFPWDAPQGEDRCPQDQPLQLAGVQNRPRSRPRTERVEWYRADAAPCVAGPLQARCCPPSRSGRNLTRSVHEELMAAHRQKMATPEAQALDKQRQKTVEPSWGDTKQHRNFRRVRGRGLDQAKSQTGRTVRAHNLWEFVKALLGADPEEQKT
jgi:hypothetical protein